jgi:F0F1-type ATP synthase membrane subunit b/b'
MTTVDLNVTLQLPEDIERKAREAGLFTGERIGELITAEIERQRREAAARLTDTMDKIHAHMRAKYGDLTDNEAQAMIDQWIIEADEETTDHYTSATA